MLEIEIKCDEKALKKCSFFGVMNYDRGQFKQEDIMDNNLEQQQEMAYIDALVNKVATAQRKFASYSQE